MKYEFINRIWIPGAGKIKARKIILFVLGAIILLATVFQGLMEGFDKINWFASLGIPAILIFIGMMGTRTGGYISTACVLVIEDNKVRVIYPAINRLDKQGTHKEELVLTRAGIVDIQYSNALKSYRILGEGTLITEFGGNEEKKTALSGNNHLEIILYPKEEQVLSMLDGFERILDIEVQQMDNS